MAGDGHAPDAFARGIHFLSCVAHTHTRVDTHTRIVMAYISFESEAEAPPKKRACPRHRRKGYRKERQAAAEAAETAPEPLADPSKPVPNLKAADTFEV